VDLTQIASRLDVKTIFKNEWLSLKDLNGYIYMHQEKSDGKAIAVLIYRSNKEKPICGRFERVPCHFDGITLCALTGMVENNDFINTAIKEIFEEAGIICTKNELIDLGTIKNSKASDTVTQLYALDVKDRNIDNDAAIGDGTEGEKDAYCEWVSYKDAVNCKDPLMATLIKRAEITGILL